MEQLPRLRRPLPARVRGVAPSLESATTDIAAQVEPGRTSMLAALRYRDFRLFWVGLLVSNLGTWMQMFGMGWLVVQLAIRDGVPQLAPLYLGLTGLARAVPGLALGLFAGAVADRSDRRQLLIVTQTIAGFLALLLATLTATGAITIWSILLIGAASSAVFSFDAPTRQSMVRRLVPERDIMSAIGLNSAGFNGPQIVGPALGGVLLGLTNVAALFFANAATYLAVIIALFLMQPMPVSGQREASSVLESVRDGLRYMRNDPVLRGVIVLAAATQFFARPYVFLLPAIAEDPLHAGAPGLSALMTMTGVGALSGSIIVANLGVVKRRGRVFLASTAGMGLTLMLFTVQSSLVPALGVALLVGATMLVFNGVANTIMQTSAPDHLRGRVLSVMTMIFMGLMPLGQLVLGAAGSAVGVNTALFVGGMITAAAAAYAFVRLPAVRNLSSTRRPHPHPHPSRAAPAPAD